MSRNYNQNVESARNYGFVILAAGTFMLMLFGYFTYSMFRIDVPAKHIAVLMKRTGDDIDNEDEIAPDNKHKGVQKEILTEGRYFYNAYSWDWDIYPMVEIPEGKMGIRVRLSGESLPYGDFVATAENQKGIVKDVLRPGRYPINAIVKENDQIIVDRRENNYAEIIITFLTLCNKLP